MIRTFFRHMWESIKSLKRNGWMTIASISAVAITLTMLGLFLAVILNATKVAEDVEKNVDVTTFVDIGTNEKDRNQLKKDLEGLDHVSKVTFSSKEDQLKKIQDTMGDAWDLFEGDANPLYDVFVVSASDPDHIKDVATEASALPNVFKADYGGTSSDRIFKLSKLVRTWGLGAAVLLILIAIFLISNTIRITILSRKREIQIMRLVGAKNGYIRWPFFLEGGWIGILGAILPAALLYFGYTRFYNFSNPYMLQSNLSLVQPNDLVWKVILVLVLIGYLIGAIGSVISMRRFLKI